MSYRYRPNHTCRMMRHVVCLRVTCLVQVFRMWTGGGDSQLVNSVYFDNRQMQVCPTFALTKFPRMRGLGFVQCRCHLKTNS